MMQGHSAVSSTPNATEHWDPPHWDPPIRLEKSLREFTPNPNSQGAHHKRRAGRPPDIALKIRVFIPSGTATERAADIEYSGDYVGHGQSKTVFKLHCPNEYFDGTILKVAKKMDMEPGVFTQAYQYGLTTRILYNAGMAQHAGAFYHCWITEPTIPLDEFAQYYGAEKCKCTLAAFCCILRAAKHGFYLSDCHFFNFGVKITNDATEHKVVIIDAGSRGIHAEQTWSKSDITKKCMNKFWQWSHAECASNAELERNWRGSHDWKECLKWAEQKWQESPLLTTASVASALVQEVIRATERDAIEQRDQTSQYQIMKMVGRFACHGQWSHALSKACYRATQQLLVTLQHDEMEVLEQLHSRIVRDRDEAQITAVIAIWFDLQEYRESWISAQTFSYTDSYVLSVSEVHDVLQNYFWYTLWYEQTEEQKKNTKNMHSRMNALLHKKAAWTHVANAVIKHGLPKIQSSTDDATEHINALGTFAKDLAQWLQFFAQGLNEYRNTPEYEKARKDSQTPMAHPARTQRTPLHPYWGP
jgi:hypothetical protein